MLLSSMRLVTGCIHLSSLLFKDHTCVVIITTMLREWLRHERIMTKSSEENELQLQKCFSNVVRIIVMC